MANYNINPKFGSNILPQNVNSVEQKTSEINTKQKGIFESYFEKNKDVFEGNVEKEINTYSRQAMIVAMNLKNADKTVRRFDISI